jgi:hypothetical protein
MPQPKQHASAAARQAAFRVRREQARQADLARKGLPALPPISSMPGWPRWKASFQAAQQLMAASLSEMQDYFDERSETWQESLRGEEHQTKIASAEAVQEALSDLLS